MPCDLICTVLLSHYEALVLLNSINQFFRRETGCVYCKVGTALLYLVSMVCGEHVEWLGWLVANLSRQRRGFDARPVRVGFVVDRVAVGQFSLGLLQFSPVSIIPPMLHTHMHPYATHIRRTCAWSMGTYKWAVLIHILGSTGQNRTLTLFVWCACDSVAIADARLLACVHLHSVTCMKTRIVSVHLQ